MIVPKSIVAVFPLVGSIVTGLFAGIGVPEAAVTVKVHLSPIWKSRPDMDLVAVSWVLPLASYLLLKLIVEISVCLSSAIVSPFSSLTFLITGVAVSFEASVAFTPTVTVTAYSLLSYVYPAGTGSGTTSFTVYV